MALAKKRKILISNDDGIHAPGIVALARAIKKIKQTQVITVAPHSEQSASSHALTIHQPLRIEKISPNRYAVTGTPTDSVMIAKHVILKEKPDLLISGINRGANLGEDVHYSGTVAAAVEGALMGIPAIAISLAGAPPFRYEGACEFITKLAQKVLKEGLPKGVLLNVNVPNKSSKQLKGHHFCKLGRHDYGEVIVEKMDPRGRPYYWVTGNPLQFQDIPDSDCQAFLDNQISITPIKVDVTDYHFLKKIKTWKL